MTVAVEGSIIRLSGRCPAEDAEVLLELLAGGAGDVDLTDCSYLHGAVVQLLMAMRPTITGDPAPFVRDWLIPSIREQESP
ncbi:MAG TPA: hypothetical protein VGU01_14230 [Sphingomicrobium sp.]|nr:hypothetical protein [Sphingomicrobium sp.]